VIHNNAAALGERIILAGGQNHSLTHHPLLLVYDEDDGYWYEIDWSGSAGGVGAHHLLSLTHDDTVVNAATKGSMIYANRWDLWDELDFPGYRYHLQTNYNIPVWDENISMIDGSWIGLDADRGRLVFNLYDDYWYWPDVDDKLYFLDCDVGIGTESPNIAGEAVALTIEDPTGAPTIELSYKSDGILDGEIIGVHRWYHGSAMQQAAGQIDMVGVGVYEDAAMMRFWASEGGALCLVMELDCDGVTVHGYTEMSEMVAPGGGAADTCRLYCVDNGGKTELYAVFSTGAAQLIAAEP